MVRTHRFGAALVVAATLAAFVLGTAAPASAKLIERSHDRNTITFDPDEVCGIPVVTTVTFVDNFMVRTNRQGYLLFQDSGRSTVTWTNPENGKSVSDITSGISFKDLSVTVNSDGTVTVRTAIVGVPETLRLPDGTVLVRDVGRLVLATVLDDNGTPGDPEDDIFVSSSVESVSGPHPELDSDFTLFCDTVVPALT